MPLKLLGIGAFGNMLSHASNHLANCNHVQFIRVLDRGKQSAHHCEARKNWKLHGARGVRNFEELISSADDFDGIFICAGKNGDDKKIFEQLLSLLSKKNHANIFIIHLSTVSPNFVKQTSAFCQQHHVDYANYPLTGGVAGAKAATMLILASGDEILFQKVKPILKMIGRPQFFGTECSRGAEVKFLSHIMLFHNLCGIGAALGLDAALSHLDKPEESQVEFFNFLNQGAGGSRQWDLVAKPSLETNDLVAGFLLKHAVVDVLYASQLLLQKGMPNCSLIPLLHTALIFSFIISNHSDLIATQTLIYCIYNSKKEVIDSFLNEHMHYQNMELSINNIVATLPETIQKSILFDVSY